MAHSSFVYRASTSAIILVEHGTKILKINSNKKQKRISIK